MNRGLITILGLRLKDKSGFTVVELILTATLTSLVLAVSFSIYFLGQNMFNMGTDKSSAQENARIAADFITKDIRAAKELSADESSISNGNLEYYALMVSDGNLVKQVKQAGTVKSTVKVCPVDLVGFLASPDGMLQVSIDVSENEQEYELEFVVKLLNINSPNVPSEVGAIYYSKY